jgi:hypothetical protein
MDYGEEINIATLLCYEQNLPNILWSCMRTWQWVSHKILHSYGAWDAFPCSQVPVIDTYPEPSALALLFDPEDGGCTFLENTGGLLLDYTVLHPRRYYSWSPLWESQICHNLGLIMEAFFLDTVHYLYKNWYSMSSSSSTRKRMVTLWKCTYKTISYNYTNLGFT